MTSDRYPTFEGFYEEAKDGVFKAVLVSGRQFVRAEDAVAEAFARAFERWDTVGCLDNPTGWVVRTAMNRYNSDWRIWRRELPNPPDVGFSQETTRADDELVSLVWNLPRRQRQVVALRILVDLSEAETASVLGISGKTVSVHLHRALAALRDGLAQARNEAERWKTQASAVK